MVGTGRPSFLIIAQSAARSIRAGQDAAVGIAPPRIDHPLLAPRGGQLDPIVMYDGYFESKPLVVGRACDHRLHVFDGHVLVHQSALHVQGSTTTLPITSRSRRKRSPSIA